MPRCIDESTCERNSHIAWANEAGFRVAAYMEKHGVGFDEALFEVVNFDIAYEEPDMLDTILFHEPLVKRECRRVQTWANS